jgi:hypothetical protein
MKGILVGMLVAIVFAAPCAYDVFSTEPSPLAGLVAVVTVTGQSHW